MKAMVLNCPGSVVRTDWPDPTFPIGDALVRVSHSGVCGTDLKIYRGEIPVRYPRIMGHEMAGELIVDHSGSALGQRVLVDPMLHCGRCFHCRVGQTNLCPDGKIIGRDADGGFAEYVAVPRWNVHPLPSSIESASAPLLQVLATCVHAQRLASLYPGESVVVIGLGVTGQLHLQLAKARGARPVIGLSRSQFKRSLADGLGADLTIPSGGNAAAVVCEATSGRGADLVIETTGTSAAFAEAITMVRHGGRLLLFGINTAVSAELPFYQLYFKELNIINARAARAQDYPTAITLVEHGLLRIDPLITHRLPLCELGDAIEMVDSDAEDRLKIILEH
jgi:2-desacetyl-2-hydroxyethyl bacteriochlorophyllide A dehydrogenase